MSSEVVRKELRKAPTLKSPVTSRNRRLAPRPVQEAPLVIAEGYAPRRSKPGMY